MLSQILATLTRISANDYLAVRAMLAVNHLPVESDEIAFTIPARTCLGCKGSGRHPSRHGFGMGVCAACHGTGEKKAEQVTAIVALRELVKSLKKESGELSDTRWAEWAALPAETRDAACEVANLAHGDFGESVRKALRMRGRLTPGQVIALMKPKGQNTAAPGTAPLTAGRQPLKGTIVSIKEQAGEYGVQLKMLLKLESGARVFGTIPAQLADKVKPGDAISLVATVQPKEPDFGFFSRPTVA